MASISHAQFTSPFFRGVVGGVKIDTDGVVQNVSVKEFAEFNRESLPIHGAPAGLDAQTKMRHVSLKQVAAALTKAHSEQATISEELAFLGGLTRIEYILVYPESHDIVIAGPAENWTLGDDGVVVGTKTGAPVIRVEDLMTAFAKLNTSRPETISCSIEPTKEGTQKLTELLDSITAIPPNQSPKQYEPAMREAFGPQQVLFTGVPGDSRVGRVIFGADYQMKRICLKLKDSPVKGLPSYVDMLRHASSDKNQSRWWIACDYDKIERSEDSLAWHISGKGSKVQTEEEVIQSDGTRLSSGKPNPLAKKWADIMTDKMEELAVADPVFGELRTIMDACVVAAIIRTNGLEELAQCDLSAFQQVSYVDNDDQPAPQSVDPQCSFVQSARGWTVTASGGVLIDPWSQVRDAKVSSELSAVRSNAQPQESSWVWN